MASAVASRQCSKCNDAVGSFNCAGCKAIFCTKHSVEHRAELTGRFEQLMTDQNTIQQQMQNNSLRQQLHNQIDDWQNQMIERVRERAKDIRGQVDQLLNTDNQKMEKDVQSLADEMRTRREKEDFFENDIERIAQKIDEAKRFIREPIEEPNIELKIEQIEDIDWKDLIHIKDQSTSTSSSNSESNSGGSPRPIFPAYVNSSASFIRPQNGPFGSPYPYYSMNFMTRPFQPVPTVNKPPNLQTSPGKRERKPLAIVDPTTYELIFNTTATGAADRNQTSSTIASSDDLRAKFREQVAQLQSANSVHRSSQ